MKIVQIAFAIMFTACAATASFAATLNLVGTGYDAGPVTLPGIYDLDNNLAAFAPLDPDAVARDGSTVQVLNGENKSATNGLSLTGRSRVTFTYLGFEAGYTNAFLLGDTELFRNRGAGASAVGASYTTIAEAGLLDFTFKTLFGAQGVMSNAGVGSFVPDYLKSTIGIAYSSIFNNGRSIIVLFDDSGASVDRDFDDLGVRIDVAAVPVPAAGLMMIGAIGGLAALKRRRKVA